MNGVPEVVEEVRRRLERQGSISVAELMEISLYHPSGLYRRTAPAVGKAGHFTTCARIDPALGVAVAGWLLERRAELFGRGRRWHVIEIGGGDGSLAAAVLDALPVTARLGLVLHMVDRSEPAVALQRDRLGRRARWQPSVAAALDEAGGRALLYSNELVDAFPADVLELTAEGWREVRLVAGDRSLVEQLGDRPRWLDPERFAVARLERLVIGAKVEVHRSYLEWLELWAPKLQRGAMLTIDYGDEVERLYGRGGGGTLRAYFANIRLEERRDLYTRLGQQDLTADVCFTDLAAWGERQGWKTRALWTQRQLLQRYGALDREGSKPSAAFVANPLGAGAAFRVLWQQKT